MHANVQELFKTDPNFRILNENAVVNGTGFTPSTTYAIMIISVNNCTNYKGGENMDEISEMNNGEIIKNALEDFEKVQDCMILAKEENAPKTYAKLQRQYISLKALLNSLGVNMAAIDRIKE